MSLSSFGFVVFTRDRAGGRWVHPGSLGSIRFALGVVGFIWVYWVHSGSRWVSLASSGVVGFTRIRPEGRWFHPRSFDSLQFVLVVVGFILFFWVH